MGPSYMPLLYRFRDMIYVDIENLHLFLPTAVSFEALARVLL